MQHNPPPKPISADLEIASSQYHGILGNNWIAMIREYKGVLLNIDQLEEIPFPEDSGSVIGGDAKFLSSTSFVLKSDSGYDIYRIHSNKTSASLKLEESLESGRLLATTQDTVYFFDFKTNEVINLRNREAQVQFIEDKDVKRLLRENVANKGHFMTPGYLVVNESTRSSSTIHWMCYSRRENAKLKSSFKFTLPVTGFVSKFEISSNGKYLYILTDTGEVALFERSGGLNCKRLAHKINLPKYFSPDMTGVFIQLYQDTLIYLERSNASPEKDGIYSLDLTKTPLVPELIRSEAEGAITYFTISSLGRIVYTQSSQQQLLGQHQLSNDKALSFSLMNLLEDVPLELNTIIVGYLFNVEDRRESPYVLPLWSAGLAILNALEMYRGAKPQAFLKELLSETEQNAAESYKVRVLKLFAKHNIIAFNIFQAAPDREVSDLYDLFMKQLNSFLDFSYSDSVSSRVSVFGSRADKKKDPQPSDIAANRYLLLPGVDEKQVIPSSPGQAPTTKGP